MRRYVKGIVSFETHFVGYPMVLECYWISNADEIYVTSEYMFKLGGGPVLWKSCKKTILTRSIMEAELTILDIATIEAKWLRELLIDLSVAEKPKPAISMNCDNQTVTIKVNNSKDNITSTRHIKGHSKSVKILRNSKVTALDYVHTCKNMADQFTKGLACNSI